ncbi:uncharacterized protein CTRU02_215798 [Colletotrichum truncatum]|uniref:Uncharacterized protein n=1 Tax=Colletotrichum truncatum TaxID=5467 RepID=A0ACC3YBP7_COLTU|nr:uncharacterized protein CTRU02_15081 [Colletotrichum truncatum]KAF6781441.1 hypothetical protein CTRU02_15081 [Colletotrichum truncatum]
MVKPTGRQLWEQYARQIQRLYHADDPPHPNRNLITEEHLGRAALLQPEFELLAPVEGRDDEVEQESAWPEEWVNRRSLMGVLNRKEWKTFPIRHEEQEHQVIPHIINRQPSLNPWEEPVAQSTSQQPASATNSHERKHSPQLPLEDSEYPLDRSHDVSPTTRKSLPDMTKSMSRLSFTRGYGSIDGQLERIMLGGDYSRGKEMLSVDHRGSLDERQDQSLAKYQQSHKEAGPADDQGSSGTISGTKPFAQDDLKMFLAWRRGKRKPRSESAS